ncbi:MAG: CD225/dispanin family protein [Muribaculaceae bacterium]|nr:CD225/dispanin family protein [Muribaculaceae bacterium]MDE6320824.1 CD225/dispanin family protein [Muribaculaceae bacterium]
MEYWIIVNEKPQGPYTITELSKMRVTPDTKVWRTGLSDWVEANTLEELEYVITQGSAVDEPAQVTESATPDVPPPSLNYAPSAYAAHGSVQQPSASQYMPQPPTYLGWNIAMLICCCLPAGIIGLIFSMLSASRYRQGEYELAKRWSRRAELMVIISFTLGCVLWPFSVLMQMLLQP